MMYDFRFYRTDKYYLIAFLLQTEKKELLIDYIWLLICSTTYKLKDFYRTGLYKFFLKSSNWCHRIPSYAELNMQHNIIFTPKLNQNPVKQKFLLNVKAIFFFQAKHNLKKKLSITIYIWNLYCVTYFKSGLLK